MLILRNSGSFSACNIIAFVSRVLKPNVMLVSSLEMFPLLRNSISFLNPLKTAFVMPRAGRGNGYLHSSSFPSHRGRLYD